MDAVVASPQVPHEISAAFVEGFASAGEEVCMFRKFPHPMAVRGRGLYIFVPQCPVVASTRCNELMLMHFFLSNGSSHCHHFGEPRKGMLTHAGHVC